MSEERRRWYIRVGLDPEGPQPLLYRLQRRLLFGFVVLLFGAQLIGTTFKALVAVSLLLFLNVVAVGELLYRLMGESGRCPHFCCPHFCHKLYLPPDQRVRIW
jgi:hypothetical protein